MRAGNMQLLPNSGRFLLAAGGVLLALALALLVYTALDSGGGSSTTSVQGSAVDPYSATNGTIAFWEQRVHTDPLDYTAYNRLATAYIQRGRQTGDVADYTRAQAAVDASLRSAASGNAGATSLKAALQIVRHDFAGALETARQAIALDPGDASAHTVTGDAQLALGQYRDAYATYDALVTGYPGPASFSRLAHILELQGRTADARAAWKNAISTDGGRNAENTAWAHVQFGNFYFATGDLDSADDQYQAAIGALPEYVHGLAGRARVAAARGDYATAIDLYTRVAARQPLPEYVSALGDVSTAAGQPEQAQKQYSLVLAINDLYKANGINTDMAMALFLADHDLEPTEALRQAQTVYAAQPGNIYTADALAWALYKNRRSAEAATHVQEALRLGTQDATLYFHAGLIARANGDTAGAKTYLAKALEINPQFSALNAPIAHQALQELGG